MPTRAARVSRLGTEAPRRLPGPSLVAALAWAVVCGVASAAGYSATPAPRVFETSLTLGEQTLSARWTLPAGEVRGVALLQHGFTRRCTHLTGTTRYWADAGLAVLCVDVSGVAGAVWLPDDLADALAGDRLRLPDGAALPERIVVAGHSAGATFAVRVGARLAALAPGRLSGAVLLDPVASRGLDEALHAISQGGARPVLAALAQPGPCNANGSAEPVLHGLLARVRATGGDGFVGVRFGPGSTHVDAEGEDTTAMAVRACGQGWPQEGHVRALRELGSGWALEMIAGTADGAGAGRVPGAVPVGAAAIE